MGKFKFGEADTGGGNFFNITGVTESGARLMVLPTAHVEDKKMPFGKADVLEADVVNLDTGDVFYDAEITKSVPRKAFAEFVDKGEPLLVKFVYGSKLTAKGEKITLFENLTSDPQTVALAEVYLEGHPGFLDGTDRAAARAEREAKANGDKPADPEAAAKAALGALGATTVTTEVKTIPKAIYDSLDAAGKAKLDADGYQVV